MNFPAQRGSASGFSLIELLVTLVIIGIVSAIAIPSLVNALDRGRQKRTMSDIHAIGTAIQSYNVDFNVYPASSSVGQLATILEQESYIRNCPRIDAWNNQLVYSGVVDGYTIGSTGKDGGASLALAGGGGATGTFEADIIFSNGSFVQWPQGMQE